MCRIQDIPSRRAMEHLVESQDQLTAPHNVQFDSKTASAFPPGSANSSRRRTTAIEKEVETDTLNRQCTVSQVKDYREDSKQYYVQLTCPNRHQNRAAHLTLSE